MRRMSDREELKAIAKEVYDETKIELDCQAFVFGGGKYAVEGAPTEVDLGKYVFKSSNYYYNRGIINFNNTFNFVNGYNESGQVIVNKITKIKNVSVDGELAGGLFSNCTLITALENVKLKNVKNARYMFQNCQKLTNYDVDGADSIEIAQYMFGNNSAMITPPSWIGSMKNITHPYGMFSGCTNITSVPAVMNLSNMSLATLPGPIESGFTNMFVNCTHLTVADMSDWIFNPAVSGNFNTNNMFSGCTALTKVIFGPEFNIYRAATAEIGFSILTGQNIFNNCTALNTIVLKQPGVQQFSSQIAAVLPSTFINNEDAFIYVPDDLVDTYKAHNYWTSVAAKIKGISELPED